MTNMIFLSSCTNRMFSIEEETCALRILNKVSHQNLLCMMEDVFSLVDATSWIECVDLAYVLCTLQNQTLISIYHNNTNNIYLLRGRSIS